SRPSLTGVVVAVFVVGTAVALAFWPVGGRTGEQWLPVVARWGFSGATGRRFQPDPNIAAGAVVSIDAGGSGVRLRAAPGRPRNLAPSVFDGLHLVSAGPGGMGMVLDDRASTVTA